MGWMHRACISESQKFLIAFNLQLLSWISSAAQLKPPPMPSVVLWLLTPTRRAEEDCD